MTDKVVVSTISAEAWKSFDLIHAEYIEQERKPGEITVREWRERYKIKTIALAYGELESMVNDDPPRMKRRVGRVLGQKCNLYSIVNNNPPPE